MGKLEGNLSVTTVKYYLIYTKQEQYCYLILVKIWFDGAGTSTKVQVVHYMVQRLG